MKTLILSAALFFTQSATLKTVVPPLVLPEKFYDQIKNDCALFDQQYRVFASETDISEQQKKLIAEMRYAPLAYTQKQFYSVTLQIEKREGEQRLQRLIGWRAIRLNTTPQSLTALSEKWQLLNKDDVVLNSDGIIHIHSRDIFCDLMSHHVQIVMRPTLTWVSSELQPFRWQSEWLQSLVENLNTKISHKQKRAAWLGFYMSTSSGLTAREVLQNFLDPIRFEWNAFWREAWIPWVRGQKNHLQLPEITTEVVIYEKE